MRHPKWRNAFLLFVILLAIIASLVNGRRRKNRNRKRSSNSKYMNDYRDYPLRKNFVIVSGDIYFGALMQMHNGGRSDICGNLSHTSMLELEALLFTVEMINIHTSLLPGIKLGLYVRDTCADPDHALKQALTIMEGRYSESPRWSYRCRGGEIAESLLPTINGIITSIQSPAANVQAASLLQLFRLPQINAKSRSPLLRTVGRFPYLHHSVPSYFQQLGIVIDLLKHLRWSYIHVIFEDSEYGSWLNYKLQEILRNNGICVATNMMIPPFISTRGKKQSYDMIATRILHHTWARGVLIATESDQTAAEIMSGVKRQGGSRRLAFLGIGWGENIKSFGIENELEGALVLQLTENDVLSFSDYMEQKDPLKYRKNPWFQKFWQELFRCRMPSERFNNRTYRHRLGKIPLCNGKEDIAKVVKTMKTDAEHLSNAIMAFAQTLHNIHWDYCQGVKGICDAMKPLSGEVLSKYLENVRFKSMSGHPFEFHSQREPKAEYRLMNFQQISRGQYKWINLGRSRMRFSNETLRAIKFRWAEPVLPPSICSLPCEPGHIKRVQNAEDCCFVCIPCPPDHYMPSENVCLPCPNGTAPALDYYSCVPSLSVNRKATSAAERRAPTNSTAERVKQTTRRKKVSSSVKKSENFSNVSVSSKRQHSTNKPRLISNHTLSNSMTDNNLQENVTVDLEMEKLIEGNATEEEEVSPKRKTLKNVENNETKQSKPNKNFNSKKIKNIVLASNNTSVNSTEETEDELIKPIFNNITRHKAKPKTVKQVKKENNESKKSSKKFQVLTTTSSNASHKKSTNGRTKTADTSKAATKVTTIITTTSSRANTAKKKEVTTNTTTTKTTTSTRTNNIKNKPAATTIEAVSNGNKKTSPTPTVTNTTTTATTSKTKDRAPKTFKMTNKAGTSNYTISNTKSTTVTARKASKTTATTTTAATVTLKILTGTTTTTATTTTTTTTTTSPTSTTSKTLYSKSLKKLQLLLKKVGELANF
ncbi:metabotropic glutamate receptor 3-like [Argonauta hians]